GRKVRILGQKGEFFGVAKGIDVNGELLVEKENGSIEKITSGEVSVRGIYGYI
ncbi:MAG: biotin--[acetyl-CoA-carboxylase] ligase, partial [Vallitaleaceae bacterium]|nr:biotin--[acetyl-CoA-carboxylase] ligase [Vallitaleaceae bacterium]